MASIIAVTNQKGGVGKTTTAINLASSLTESRMRPNVLLIDLDPQGNATMGIGINKYELDSGAIDVLMAEKDIAETIVDLEDKNLRVIPSNGDLTGAEVILTQQENGAYTLKKALEAIQSNFDFIILDCAPTLNMLTINALTASSDIIIPVQCEYFALEGISSLMETIEQVKATTNPDLAILGVLRTMFDGRNTLSNQVSEELEVHFERDLFETIIPRNIRLAEAPSHGVPITIYDARSKGAEAYVALAKEVIARKRRKG